MTEAAGSAALAGNSADGGNTAAAEATTAPAAPQAEWLGKLPEDIRGLAEVKGWNKPDPGEAFAAVADGYRNLEKLVGGERLALPKDENDKAGWEKVWNRLGRPEKVDDYKITTPEGADPAFAKTMAAAFHEAGLSTKQANALAAKYAEYAGGTTKAAQDAAAVKSEQELSAFRGELGAKYDETIEAAKRVVKADGLSNEDLAALESVWGTGKMMRYFAKRAGEVLEDKGPQGTLTPSMNLTPAGAKAKIAQLNTDDSFMKKYLNDDPMVRKEAIAEMERLHKLAAAGQAA